uniref:Uncharacterized protein n=1 Tax=Cucumis melo TaxID=3656 RepID=A0A9I9EIC0_CUCME
MPESIRCCNPIFLPRRSVTGIEIDRTSGGFEGFARVSERKPKRAISRRTAYGTLMTSTDAPFICRISTSNKYKTTFEKTNVQGRFFFGW